MIIQIFRIPPDGESYSGEDPASILGLDGDPALTAESPLRYNVFVQVIPNQVVVRGKLSVDVSFACSRCGEASRLTVTEPAFDCVREYTDLGESVDLTEEIREAMILAFPHYPVCRPLCKGLCPQCGANLNKTVCRCDPAARQGGAWGPLEGLKL